MVSTRINFKSVKYVACFLRRNTKDVEGRTIAKITIKKDFISYLDYIYEGMTKRIVVISYILLYSYININVYTFYRVQVIAKIPLLVLVYIN